MYSDSIFVNFIYSTSDTLSSWFGFWSSQKVVCCVRFYCFQFVTDISAPINFCRPLYSVAPLIFICQFALGLLENVSDLRFLCCWRLILSLSMFLWSCWLVFGVFNIKQHFSNAFHFFRFYFLRILFSVLSFHNI